ncbi:MAG: hypothetical protein JXX14_19810 [Deltaproteobacteria bacterium]|nr:hypothetical protein [Deltaproteobacteria bacterium]
MSVEPMRHAANNPFRTSRVESVAWHPYPDEVTSIYFRWMKSKWRGQVVGHHGAGKTTLCQHLITLAEADGLSVRSLFANRQCTSLTLAPWREAAARPSSETLLVRDGIGHVPGRIQKRLLRNTPRLLSACHEPLADIPIIARLQSNLPLLQTLTREMSGDEGLRLLGTDGGAALLQSCNGNLREVFRRLYHLWLENGCI